MAQKLHNFITKLNALKNTANLRLLNIVNEKSGWIEDKNRERLTKGKLSDGSQITNLHPNESASGTSRYSKLHARIRHEARLQDEYVDLKFKGKFYESIKYKKTAKGGQIISTDSDKKKVDDIDSRYGTRVLGLTEDELQTLADQSAQQLATFIAQKISD